MQSPLRSPLAFLIFTGLALAPHAAAQEADLSSYFGFTGLEIAKIGENPGPVIAADMNADGLPDLIIANNHASRIEIHYQKANASPNDEVTPPSDINEFPEHWRFRRENVSVSHQVSAIAPHDFDGDGMMDLIYAGHPSEVVFLRQMKSGRFDLTRRQRVRDLSANRDGFAVADILGDARPELVGLVKGEIVIWPLRGDMLGQPTKLAASDSLVAFLIEDYDGDGRLDIAGILPDDAAPLRVWFGGAEGSAGVIGAQVRFEMPPLIEVSPVRLPGEHAARIAVIERVSKRIVVYRVLAEQIERTGDRDASIRVFSFTDPGNRERAHTVADIDGDGMLDLLATDTEANAVVLYRQVKGKGLQLGDLHPSLADLAYLAAGNVDDDETAEVFVLSEEESVIGRSDVAEARIPFPLPLNLASGYTPVAMNLVALEDGPRVAVIVKNARDHRLDLISMNGTTASVELGTLSRSPDTILAQDADQDGNTDLLLFTRERPMTMLHATAEGFKLTESDQMGQYGLVQAANAGNVARFDIDGDEKDELLIAEKNFLRAVRYEPEPPGGVSPGWQVVTQINADDPSSKLVSIATFDDRLVAADQQNDRLIIMTPRNGSDTSSNVEGVSEGENVRRWEETESLAVRGFKFNEIHAGSFSGDGEENVLAVGDDGFAIIRLAGERITLEETNVYRSTDERDTYHELTEGDVNNDGFADLIALDAGQQKCSIFTFSEAGQMHHALGFPVFESQLFGGGGRAYEPRQALIVDITGDHANDLVLLAHDRLLIYPQMTKENARE